MKTHRLNLVSNEIILISYSGFRISNFGIWESLTVTSKSRVYEEKWNKKGICKKKKKIFFALCNTHNNSICFDFFSFNFPRYVRCLMDEQ